MIAVLAASVLNRRCQAVSEVALRGFSAGLVGERLYFLATSWSEVPPHWWGPFAVWRGGLGRRRTTPGFRRGGSAGRRPLLPLLCDWERVLVTAGGAVGTWDGDARSACVVSTAGS